MSHQAATGRSAACPSCEALASPKMTYRSPHNRTEYTLQHCPGCALEFWTPLEVDLSIYQDDGFDAYRSYHAGTRPFPRWALALFEQPLGDVRRALDIGCGDGAVMWRLKETGIDVSGIDLDADSVTIARQRCGQSSCRVATLEQYVGESGGAAEGFDLITFFEVLEHQVDPKGFLAHVATLLAAGGRIAGSVPNRSRFLSSLDRRIDSGDMPPHHHLWFSRRALEGLLARAGFVAIEVRHVGSEDFATTRGKVARVLARLGGRLPRPLRRMSGWIAPQLAFPLALLPWLGRRLAPSHLYFQGRLRAGDAPA